MRNKENAAPTRTRQREKRSALLCYFCGGLPGPGRFLKRSISSSSQMYVLRCPLPMKFIWFSGFWAYFTTASTLHPHISATSLLIFIINLAIVTSKTPDGNPSGFARYFTIRRVIFTASRIVRPVIIKMRPIVPKSIDNTSCLDYSDKAGACAPVHLLTLCGQARQGLTLLWLRCLPKRLTAIAGLLYSISYYHLLQKAVLFALYNIFRSLLCGKK